MAIDNLTIFELHLDDARFSPVIGGSEEAVDAAAAVEAADAGEYDSEGYEAGADGDGAAAAAVDESGSKGLGYLLGATALLVAVFLARRRFGGDDEGEDYDADEFSADEADQPVEIAEQ